MKKNVFVMLFFTFGLFLSALTIQAAPWGDDPANDPVYQQFMEDSADLRKEIEKDLSDLNTLSASENPDTEKTRELTARITENKKKFFELARAKGLAGGGGCGGSKAGGSTCGSGCSGGSPPSSDKPVPCGSPNCPSSVPAQ